MPQCIDCSGPLLEIVGQHPTVQVGSYPNTGKPGAGAYGVKIQLSGRSSDALEAAVTAIRGRLEVFDL